MGSLWQDVRYGARALARTPGFTVVALVTLALGIGATTAVVGLVDALFFRQPPVRHPSSLVLVSQTRAGETGSFPLAYADYLDYRAGARTLADLAAEYPSAPLNFVAPDTSAEINGSVVTANYFPLLGLTPERGRFFRPDEDEVPDRDPVAVVSDAFWRGTLGGDPEVLGRQLRLNGVAFTVVGVAPAGFEGVRLGGLAIDVWIPSMMLHTGYRYCDAFSRDCRVVRLVGRLAPGRTIAEARAELAGLAGRLATAYPDTNAGRGVDVSPVAGAARDAGPGRTRAAVLLLAAVGLVLLTACANLGGLLLARATARRREMAVRLAVGAGRGRLLRQLLTESQLLAIPGGALGLIVAAWTTDLLQAFYAASSEGQRTYFPIGLDWHVLAAALVLSLVAGLAFGLAPALQASRADVTTALTDTGAAPGGRRSRLRDGLVIAEVALSVVLLVGAGLLVRSLASIQEGPGFDPARVVLLRLRPGLVNDSPARAAAFLREAVRRVEAVPGVVAASPAAFPPFWRNRLPVWRPGTAPSRPDAALSAAYNVVGPRYFETLGVALAGGRGFGSEDGPETERGAIVNETLARRLWPDGDPVGRSLVVDGRPCTVIGVARDAQYRSVGEPPTPFVYLDFWQQEDLAREPAEARLHVRVSGEAGAALGAIRRAVASVDPEVPISEDRPLTAWLAHAFQPVRVAGTMLSAFGGLALLLSAIGLYGVLAVGVGLRRREIAIRRALGAGRGAVATLVVRNGLTLALGGLAAGLAGAVVASRLFTSLLYDVGRYDPITWAGAPALLLVVAAAASWLPARRATRIDPAATLRGE